MKDNLLLREEYAFFNAQLWMTNVGGLIHIYTEQTRNGARPCRPKPRQGSPYPSGSTPRSNSIPRSRLISETASGSMSAEGCKFAPFPLAGRGQGLARQAGYPPLGVPFAHRLDVLRIDHPGQLGDINVWML